MNVKVTDLPQATTPLTGTEVAMVVQGGQSRQVAVEDIAPSVAAEYLVLAASGQLGNERVFTPDPNVFTTIDNGPGNPYDITINAAWFNGFADPSTEIGLVMVPGTAVTALRSDSAPALSQAIAPTWSGQHQWGLPLWAPDGAVGTPAITFTNDPNSGVYSVAPDDVGISTNGVLRWDVSTTAITSTLQQLGQAGSAGAPAWSFSGDPNSGLYSAGADDVGIATGGTLRWDVSTTAITSTLQRLGQAGTVGAPAYSYSGDPNSGFYSSGADTVALSLGGVQLINWTAAGSTYSSVFLGPNGAVGAPTYSFSADPNTGVYSVGADDLGITTGGTLRWDVSTTAITSTLQRLGQAGAVGAPAYSFSGDPNSGLYSVGADDVGIATNGVLRWDVSTTAITSTLQMLAAAGAVGAPTYSFSGDPNSGLYSVGADDVGIATNGVLRWDVSTTAITSTLQMLASAGTAGAPTYSFSGDPNTGAYSVGADDWGVSAGGTLRFDISTTAITATLPYLAPAGTASAPAYSFSVDTDLGFYRDGTNSVSLSCGNEQTFEFGQNLFRLNGTAPSLYQRENDVAADTGLWRQVASGGALIFQTRNDANNAGNSWLQIDRTTTTVGVATWGITQHVTPVGTAGAPSYTFVGDLDTGIYHDTGDSISFSVGGTQQFLIRPTLVQIQDGAVLRVPDGAVGAPSYTFRTDANTGIYSIAADSLGIATGGVLALQFTSTQQARFINVGTTASAANAFLNSGSNNELQRSTSSIRYKTDVIDIDTQRAIQIIQGLRPITYKSLCHSDDKELRWFGFVAEDVAKVEPRLVHYTKLGPVPEDEANDQRAWVPDGVQYDRIVPPLIAYVRSLESRVAYLESLGGKKK